MNVVVLVLHGAEIALRRAIAHSIIRPSADMIRECVCARVDTLERRMSEGRGGGVSIMCLFH